MLELLLEIDFFGTIRFLFQNRFGQEKFAEAIIIYKVDFSFLKYFKHEVHKVGTRFTMFKCFFDYNVPFITLFTPSFNKMTLKLINNPSLQLDNLK